jgi:hypothetical protein
MSSSSGARTTSNGVAGLWPSAAQQCYASAVLGVISTEMGELT